MTPRLEFAAVAATLALVMVGCAATGDLGRDAFAGTWSCDGVPVALSERSVAMGGMTRRTAFIETGGNADVGITATDGTRYSIFDLSRRTMTLHDHGAGSTYACRRVR